jgi:tetratricopeptide (TPR) repeat protein
MPSPPWRDPHEVSPEELGQYIARLEQTCLDRPKLVEARVMLGVAYAMNFEVYKSIDALELATQLEPDHFWAQFKYAELQYRLRALARAEEETKKAVELARNPWELSLVRKQQQEIRRMRREGARDVTWDKPLLAPVLFLIALLLFVSGVMMWK